MLTLPRHHVSIASDILKEKVSSLLVLISFHSPFIAIAPRMAGMADPQCERYQEVQPVRRACTDDIANTTGRNTNM